MAEEFDKDNWEKFAQKFKVSQEIFEQYKQFYDKNILPRIQKKHLSDLIAVVEDMINERISGKIQNNRQQEDNASTVRRYRIVLSDTLHPKNGNSLVICFPYGAVITYDPASSEQDICMLISRQLGHLLLEHGFLNADTEDHADLFAHFASGGN